MSSTAIRNAITQHIQSIGFTHPIMYQNQSQWVTPSNKLWLRVSILMGEKGQLTLSDTDEQVGIVQVDIFAPKASGTFGAYGVADALDSAFSRLNPIESNGVKIYVQSIAPAQPVEDDPWWLVRFSASIRCFVAKQ